MDEFQVNLTYVNTVPCVLTQKPIVQYSCMYDLSGKLSGKFC